MSGKARKASGSFRILDFFIIVIFLSIAALSLNLFRIDLLGTINLHNVEPVGTVVVRKNIVQRRHSDRVLWDRLSRESPVYIGDLIRVAEISAATLNVEGSAIDVEENTLIRITRSADGKGLQIDLSEGTIFLVAGSSGGITIDIDGKQVLAAPGTELSAASEADGFSLQVSRGNARLTTEGEGREISSGMAVTMDTAGNELARKAAVVITPSPNARYLKDTTEPFSVNFFWNRINLEPSQMVRLELALDRNFSQIFRVVDNLNNQAYVLLDASLWFWRLCFEDTVLSTGQLTIADAVPELESPAMNSLIRYQDELPVVNFQWSRSEEVVSYIIEISDTPDFARVRLRSDSYAAFFSDSSLEDGLWYWRVMPVFPPVYEGRAGFSRASSFRIERGVHEEEANLAQWLASQAPPPVEVPPEPVLAPVVQVDLLSPADGASISGLAALRGQAVFQWDTNAEITGSRFIISSNPDPLQGRPAIVIQNPGRTIRVDRLGEGTWYWTVELQTADAAVSALQPRRLVVPPIPLLPAAGSMSPGRGVVFGQEYLQSRRNIVFSWSAVQGANAYIFTLYQQTPSGRRQIIRTTESRTGYTLSDFSLLDRGTFVWQVEAVNQRDGVVEQRGRAGENIFVVDFPAPLPVQIEDTGILYGN